MDNETLAAIYREANGITQLEGSLVTPDSVFRAMRAAMASEREACAKVCDTHTVDDTLVGVGIAQSCAAIIRARKD